MSGGRRLRAVRPPAAVPALFAREEALPPGGPAITFAREGNAQAPMVLLRVGAQDVQVVRAGAKAGILPSGMVVGLGEHQGTITAVRGVATDVEVPWSVDPLLYKTALPGFRTNKVLQGLDYTPGRDADPYTVEDLQNGTDLRRIARAAVGPQFDVGASAMFAGSFVIQGPDDPFVAVTAAAIAASLDARDAFGERPMIAPLYVRLRGANTRAEQARLITALTKRRPDAFLLHMDGLDEASSAKRVAAAMRFALALDSVAGPVLLGRPGDLRRFAFAVGLPGVETGLGRLLRFAVPDYGKSGGGPGPVPVRFEFVSLCMSLAESVAAAAFNSGRLPESDCECSACSAASSIAEQLAGASLHDLHAVHDSASAVAGMSVTARVEQLDRDLAQARWRWTGIKHERAAVAQKRIDTWRRALTMLSEQGLLERDGAAQSLGLTG